jgi:hypothetical protein
MNQRSTLRKLILDLTPLIDMITILMFGVMIHAVEISRGDIERAEEATRESTVARERSKGDRQALMEVADLAEQRAERLKELEMQLKMSQEELKALRLKMDQERVAVADALAKLLGGLDQERLKKLLADQDFSQSGAKRLLDALKEAEKDPGAAYKAIRRIEEMERVFTFIDLHLDADDFLHISMEGRKLDRLPMRNKTAAEVEATLKDKLEPADFSQVVLFMFSNAGAARNYSVEMVEQGIKDLRQFYQGRYSAQGKQFRYASVGIVDHPPATPEKR